MSEQQLDDRTSAKTRCERRVSWPYLCLAHPARQSYYMQHKAAVEPARAGERRPALEREVGEGRNEGASREAPAKESKRKSLQNQMQMK
mmetsp:Transcript_96235/g.201050  ORF Transcript_96235/g.201050 Transcript_96235/m.201050 type:complete len:89 (-) Transcript_96235:248-514(-)